jgi:hypothetical protein
MHLKSTRTYLEARVGAFHSVEILLHVRRQDLPWFNEQQASSTRELFSILQRSILPRMFATEIEVSHAKETGKQLPPPLGPGGLPIEVGETNLRLQQQQKNAKKRRKLTKKQLAAEVARREKEEDKKEKDVYHAFGTTMQLTYRLEDEPKRKPPVTLLFRESGKEDQSFRGPSGRGRGDMQRLIKLSKRLIIWCYPYDTSQSIEPDPPGGMLRPEMVPMSELFRESRNEVIEIDT